MVNEANGSLLGQMEREISLELQESALARLSSDIERMVGEYFLSISSLPVFPGPEVLRKVAQLSEQELPEDGEPLQNILEDCRTIVQGSRGNGHPRFFGYVASPSTPVGAYADLLASTLNQNVTSWRSAPAATQIELTVVRWLASLFRYPESSGGLLTSGGSMANLIALHVAHRSHSGGDISRNGLREASPPMTLYASDQVHFSIRKAADLLGIGTAQVRTVNSDQRFRMDVRKLRELIEADTRNGLQPFCIVANAGTVGTGTVDPLEELASFAAEHRMWFHIDGAYGALAVLDETKRSLFNGIELSDSLALDAHKWLYTPVDCGCLLFRRPDEARRVFTGNEAESFAFWDYGIELSRRFRALKLWFTLRHYGRNKIASAIRMNNSLARYMAERVRASDDFELLAQPELSICCFRYLPPYLKTLLNTSGKDERGRIEEELNALNARIMHAVQRGGQAYLSNVELKGKFALRACILNFRTTPRDIEITLEIVREAARGTNL